MSASSFGALLGVLIAVSVALMACDRDASVTERLELVDAVAETARETELDRLQELAAREDELGGEPHDELGTLMDDLEPPDNVAELRIPVDRASTSRISEPGREEFAQIARAMVIAPDDGEPFCAVVGLGSDGTAAGTPADGDVADDCRDAVIPVQSENAHEGNPLPLWDQDPNWLDPRDPPP